MVVNHKAVGKADEAATIKLWKNFTKHLEMSCKRDRNIIKQHDKRGEITHNIFVKSLMTQDD
jgi:hypothetical protein